MEDVLGAASQSVQAWTQVVKLAIWEGIPENRILEFFHANVSEEEMERSRKMFHEIPVEVFANAAGRP